MGSLVRMGGWFLNFLCGCVGLGIGRERCKILLRRAGPNGGCGGWGVFLGGGLGLDTIFGHLFFYP